MPIQVPKWVLAVGMDYWRVALAFQLLLGDVNLTRAELSRRMGLGPSTVGNWASGSKRASFESMKGTTKVLRESLEELQANTARMQDLLDCVEANISAFDVHNAEKTKESRDARAAASRRLLSTLDAIGVPTEQDTQP